MDNPAEHACAPVARRREIFSPPPAALARLLAVTYETPGLHAFFRVAVSTGARCGQVCALRWSDLGLDRNTVCFARSLAEGPKGGVAIVPTKNGKRNRVEVDDATMNECAGTATKRRRCVLLRPVPRWSRRVRVHS